MPNSIAWPRFIPVAVLLASTAGILGARNAFETLPPHADLATFPTTIGDWHSNPLSLTPGELEVLGPGQFLWRDYQRAAGDANVNLFIAYYESQRSGDVIHSPQNCLPGSGWIPVEQSRISFERPDGTAILINRYVVAKGLNRDMVFYWYQAHGRVTPSEYWAKIYLVGDAIRMNRTDGAMIRVVTSVPSTGGTSGAQETAFEFIHEILPLLDGYIPR